MSKATLKIGRCVLAERPGRPRSDAPFSLPLARLREIEKVVRERHGQFVPDPDGTDDRETSLDYVRAAALSLAPQDLTGWCRRWAPWVGEADRLLIEAQARRRRRMISADGVAGLLGITSEERTRLGLMTIGACDVPRDERIAAARARKRERDRRRQAGERRAAGRQDRASYEAESLSRQQPWKALGISRRTWERRRDASVSRLDRETRGDTPASIAKKPHPPGQLPPMVEVHDDVLGEAGRDGVRGSRPRRWVREAEPHGSGDHIKGERA